jgi:hypothetical protein
MTNMEEKILRLAKFVMSFQRSYVHRVYGEDYKVTWDANLLHHVVGPISAAVYGAHSDCSPLLNSIPKNEYQHVHDDVYLPVPGEMQVLTIHYSNYPPALNLRRIYEGTGTTIADLVNACMYNSAAVALRYNRRSLKVIDGQLYAVPFCKKSLGVTLRTRPTPSANRTLDINLCYLRHTFQQYDVLLPSITACRRVALCKVPMEILEDMLFQIILLRFTGRVYRFEQYRKFYTAKYCSDQGDRIQCYAGIPGWSNNKFFLNFVRMDLEINKANV